MAYIDDLVGQVRDAAVRRKLEAAVNELKKRQRFGLVFEEHVPEVTTLTGLPVVQGSLVSRRDEPSDTTVYRVISINSRGKADIEPIDGGERVEANVRNLLPVKRFGEPIFPALTSLGRVQHGDPTKPYHAVINGENYHALQLFTYLYAGQVDCIYIDPPYNTGAKDWKYNNRYVDQNDSWRHSKWLSFMEKRLLLAKRLLKKNSVLVVTIDEHEVHHLGMLLERLFPDAVRQMVSIVINPKGVTQGRFSRVDEYAFFCFLGNAPVSGRGDDFLTPDTDDEGDVPDDEPTRPRWKGLLRSGTNARRQDRKNMFFPVLIDPERHAIVGTGEPLPFEKEPDLKKKINGLAAAWPVRTDGTWGNWGVGHITLRRLIEKGYVALGEFDQKRKTWAISYLSKQSQDQIASGVLNVIDYDRNKNVVDVVFSDVAARRIKTVWHRSRHDAGVGGTDVIRSLLGGRAFSFPKSVYAVVDCLAPIVRDNPDALIVDFFAGSGTTLHATALLNATDNGRRRCVLVTNNEVDAESANALHASGKFRGDNEYESKGIFEMVTRPRCEAVLTGKRGDGKSVEGSHLNGRLFSDGFPENLEFFRIDYLDPDDIDLGNQFDAILPALWLSAGGVGPREEGASRRGFSMPEGSTYGVLFREASFRKFLEALQSRKDVTHVWIVTDSEEAFAEMRAALPTGTHSSMLYRDYLRNFRINTRQNL